METTCRYHLPNYTVSHIKSPMSQYRPSQHNTKTAQGGPQCPLCPTSVDPLHFRNRRTSLFPQPVVYPTSSYKQCYSKPKPATSALVYLMQTKGAAGEKGRRADLEVFGSIIPTTNWIYCNGFSGLVTFDLLIFLSCVWPISAVNSELMDSSDSWCSVVGVKAANFKGPTFSR